METSSSFVNDGMLLILQGNLSATNKQDIQNSLLISQLAADNKFNRHDQTGHWYHTFSTTLGNIGWIIENNDFSFNQPVIPAFNLVNLALNEASQRTLAKEDMQTFRKMANVLQQLPNDSDLVELLYRGRKNTTMGANFVMAVGNLTGHDNLIVQLYCMSLVATDEGCRKYFSHFYHSQSVLFNKPFRWFKLVQSTDLYSNVRQGIIDKLGTTPSTMIKEIVFEISLKPSQPVAMKDDSESSCSSDPPLLGKTSGINFIKSIDIGPFLHWERQVLK